MDSTLRSDCPINAAVEILGDRWSLLILRDMIFGDRHGFRQLQFEMKERIASNILADRLRKLVAAGLLTKSESGRGRPASYRLAEPAIQLVPVLATLGGWGARHGGIPEEVRAAPQELENAGPDHWAGMMDDLRQRERIA